MTPTQKISWQLVNSTRIDAILDGDDDELLMRVEQRIEQQPLETKADWQSALAAIDWESMIEGDDYVGHVFASAPHGSIFICTNWVWQLARLFPAHDVQCFGFWREDNPGARIGHEVGGHDFALVDGRFIIDLWLTEIASSDDLGLDSVFDTRDNRDWPEIIRLYGDRFLWKRVPGKS